MYIAFSRHICPLSIFLPTNYSSHLFQAQIHAQDFVAPYLHRRKLFRTFGSLPSIWDEITNNLMACRVFNRTFSFWDPDLSPSSPPSLRMKTRAENELSWRIVVSQLVKSVPATCWIWSIVERILWLGLVQSNKQSVFQKILDYRLTKVVDSWCEFDKCLVKSPP